MVVLGGVLFLMSEVPLLLDGREKALAAEATLTQVKHPTPYTLHPTPHTLHPTVTHSSPYTQHPTPYTSHAAEATVTQANPIS